MIKLAAFCIIIFVCFAVMASKYKDTENKPKSYKVLYILHIVCGVAVTLFAVLHGISHFSTASTEMRITGSVTLALLLAEITIGVCLKRRESKFLIMAHRILPIVLFIFIAGHIAISRMT